MTSSGIQNVFRHMSRKSGPCNENRRKPCKQTQTTSVNQRRSNENKNQKLLNRKMYFSDDSEQYETTASQDERIGRQLEQEKEEEKAVQLTIETERKEGFEEAFREKSKEIFHLPGLTFLKFTHTKIKFCFEPCKVVKLVRKNVKFYCSLKYYEKYGVWNIRRDSFPVNYKTRIYPIFYRDEFFSVKDGTVAKAILRIYVQLKLWAQEEEEYRQEKFLRYQNGEDVVLDSDDEELFLTTEQKEELKEKTNKILKRMVPPPNGKFRDLPPEPTRRRRRKRVVEETTPPRQVMSRKRRISTSD